MQATTTGSTPQPSPQAVVDGQVIGDPREVFLALREQRNELRDQRNELANSRLLIARRLREGNAAPGADLGGLERRIAQIDKDILDVEQQIRVADAAVARAAGVPGAAVEPDFFANERFNQLANTAVGALFVLVVLLPISMAIARRIWRRGAAMMTAIPRELAERLGRIEDAVESTALEVERIGEGQRFVTHLFMENGPPNALGAGAMEPSELRERERVRRG
jgi:hypothetical protein